MAGRPPKPTGVLEMTGALKRNPKRYKARQNEPQLTAGLGEPPEAWHVSDNPKYAAYVLIWVELQSLAPWLKDADRFIAEEFCELTYARRRGFATKDERKNLIALYPKFGLTPVDRVKIDAGKPKREAATAGGWGALAAARTSRAS